MGGRQQHELSDRARPIEDNDREGILYEASYNAIMRNNFLRRNALIKGRRVASRGDNFHIDAIYIFEVRG